MRVRILAGAALAAAILVNSPLFAEQSVNDIPANAPGGGKSIEPGKVGPGSEKNSQISPTSPAVPVEKQPPPEISLPADSSAGSSSGEQGNGPEGTAPPHDPSSPGLQ
ncbi:hypothetical protein [Hyphomicrobium sp. 99]|uniref:hypothetical protein n=1 Tax=Hyphomicrobium sp. 99 TaxID=1163419 RepID=UPI0012DFE9BA|nr:hypothetical protein [Hyphomicrobium sp. 99]